MITLWLATGIIAKGAPVNPPIPGSGGGGARGGVPERWRIKIGDAEYSTFEEDWNKRPEPKDRDDEADEPSQIAAIEPDDIAPPAPEQWDGIDESALAALSLAAANNADVKLARLALDRATSARAKAENNVAEVARLRSALDAARRAAINAEIAAIRRAELARIDDEEAIFALMLLH
jgi:hypothetical protein